MVTASLRKANTPPQTIVETHEVNGVHVESKTTVAAPAPDNAGLENLIPQAPPVDNAHVAAGCEKFSEPTSTAVVKRADSTIAVPRDAAPVDGFGGDWGAEDLKFPQLKQVQGSGPLSKIFDSGTIIYGDLELFKAPSVAAGAVNPSLRFIPIDIQKQFREKLSDDQVKDGQMPRIFQSLAEVDEAGLTTRWQWGTDKPDNLAEPSARCLFLLELPEGNEHPGFALELGGKSYGPAIYYCAGGAFRECAQVIYNTAKTSLLVPILDAAGVPVKGPHNNILKRSLVYKNFWSMNWAKKDVNGYTVWRPVVKLSKDQTGDDIRAYCEGLLKTGAEE